MRYAIVGNGAAGWTAAQTLKNLDPEGEIIIFSDEPYRPYYRPLITNFVEEGTARNLFMPVEDGPGPAIRQYLSQRLVGLEPQAKRLLGEDGQTWDYDRLLLATGASPVIPELPGWPGPGTFGLRTLADAEALAQAAREARQAVVLGAGRVGLKAAQALKSLGLAVTLVELENRLASMQFDETAGEILAEALMAAGFRLFLGETLTAVDRKGDRVVGITLTSGRTLPTDLVVAALGVRPNIELAQKAGLAVNRGILVDEFLRTSDPNIYAAGDVAETTEFLTGQRLVSGLWTNAVEMGRIAGSNMAGASLTYPGAWAVLNSLEVAGIPTAAVGLTLPPPGDDYLVWQSRRGNTYRKLVFKGKVLVGALLVGDLEGVGVYTGLIRKKVPLKNLQDFQGEPRKVLVSWISRKLPLAPSLTSGCHAPG